MNRFFSLIAVGIALMGVLSSPAQSAGLPLIVSATVDYTHQTLIISGRNFGSALLVTLDSITFPTQSSAGSQVVASFPADKAPSTSVRTVRPDQRVRPERRVRRDRRAQRELQGQRDLKASPA